jgi:uncharacterized protein (TIGR02284 family)
MVADETTLSTLNHLIETLKDSTHGFTTAADDVEDAGVKSTFERLAEERAALAAELRAELRWLGGEPESNGSRAAAAHRGWIHLRHALGGGERAILKEAERGEDVAVHTFEKALHESLPPDVANVVRRQYDQVKSGHDQVKQMRNAWK